MMKKEIDLSNIKLLVCDVDGVLTDGGMYYDMQGNEWKKFNTRDGKGIELIRKVGIKVMFLTSENNAIVDRRAKKLHVDFCFMGIKEKHQFLNGFFAKNMGFSYDTTAYIGDDVNDLDAMLIAGVTACPSDAVQSVTAKADYICTNSGGNEAVREFAEKILMSQNKSINLPENW